MRAMLTITIEITLDEIRVTHRDDTLMVDKLADAAAKATADIMGYTYSGSSHSSEASETTYRRPR